jgi:hypothetical protein
MNKKFHIKITNNETGEVLQEADTCAIMGGYTVDDGAVGMALTDCSAREHGRAINAAEQTIKHVYQSHPELMFAVMLASAKSTTEEKEVGK